VRRPRRTGERRGRGGELSRTLRGRRRGSPPRSRGRTLRAAGAVPTPRCADPHGGRDRCAPCLAYDPHGGRGRTPRRAFVRDPHGGRGPRRAPLRGEAPSHGGTTRPRRGLFMGPVRLATPSTKLLARDLGPHAQCPRFAWIAELARLCRWRIRDSVSTNRRQETAYDVERVFTKRRKVNGRMRSSRRSRSDPRCSSPRPPTRSPPAARPGFRLPEFAR
jgi:hypothetical protein